VRTLHERSRRQLMAGVGVAAALAAVVWMLTQGTRGAEIATVLGLLVAGFTLRVAWADSTKSSDSELVAAARKLARDVRDQEAGILARLLADSGDPEPADLSFAQPALIYWRTDGGDRRGTLSCVEGYYQGLERGRLVVLGEAGAGKTVLAIRLILDLAAKFLAVDDDTYLVSRVPVRISLPAFDPADGADNLDGLAADVVSARLDDWLVKHLVAVFGLSPNVAIKLVADGRILPVLDGLDEMDVDDAEPRRAAAVIRALNHPAAGSLRPAIITCRTGRYQQLSIPREAAAIVHVAPDAALSSARHNAVLQDATAVAVEPLTAERVVDYLTYRFRDPTDPARIDPRWSPIVDRLTSGRDGDPLVAALASPLRLFLTITAYRHHHSAPDELTRFDTAEQLDDHLFGLLIPAVLDQHPLPSAGQDPAGAVTRWLTTLAHHLTWKAEHGGSPTDLELDLLWLAAGSRAPRYAPATLITVTITTLLTTTFLILDSSLVGVWSVLLLVSFVMMVVYVAKASSRPRVALRRLDLGALRLSSVRHYLGRLLVHGLAVGFANGIVNGVVIGLVNRFVVGFVIGFVIGFGYVLGNAFVTRSSAIDRPTRLVRQGIAHNLTKVVGVGLTYGLAVGIAVGPAVGVTGGVVYGLILRADSPWPRYLFVTLILARRGDLPRRPAIFLDWAYEAGLVRLSGIAVQFRHREFQTWLTIRGHLARTEETICQESE
jgi:hypothetical protein